VFCITQQIHFEVCSDRDVSQNTEQSVALSVITL